MGEHASHDQHHAGAKQDDGDQRATDDIGPHLGGYTVNRSTLRLDENSRQGVLGRAARAVESSALDEKQYDG